MAEFPLGLRLGGYVGCFMLLTWYWLRRNGRTDEFVGGSPSFARALSHELVRLESVQHPVGDLIREGLSCRLKFVVPRAKRC